MKDANFDRPAGKISSPLDRFLRLGEHGLSESEAERVRAVRLGAVLRNTPWMMAANVGNAAVTLAAFRDSTLFPWITLWTIFVSALAVMTSLTWWRTRDRPARQTASIRGVRKAVLYAGVLSALWAMLVAVFYFHADEHQKLVLVAITVGMSGGGGFALATIPAASITFGLFMGIGSAVALTAAPSLIGINLFILYTIYFVIIVRSSLSLCQSLSARVRAQLAADEQRDVISLLLNDFEQNASDWLWVADENHIVQRASSRFFELTGKRVEDVNGHPLWVVIPCREDKCRSIRNINGPFALREQLERREPFRDFELCVEQNGKPGIWSISAKPVFDEKGRFAGHRGVARDVTAAREARSRIEHMARHDPLTDLGNRVLLGENLDQALTRLAHFNESFSILLFDLDRFKQVNDAHGHGAGDELLEKIAEILSSFATDLDTLARIGGDEFALIHASARDPKASADLAEHIIAALEEPFQLSTGTVRIGVSIGIACAPIDGQDGDTLMRNADLALYRAKAEGRNRYRFFDLSLDRAARRRNLLEQELRNALATEALSLHFQPLINAQCGKVVCFEALVRWTHPTLGSISPAEFIPIAEDAGIVTQIGGWVIRQGCRIAAGWPQDVRIAINLSPRQFNSPGLFSAIKNAIEESGLAPGRLELEITESLLLNTTGAVESTLAALKGLGVRIALDDFGTGYSSLSYLRKYRFDKLKIDQSFIRDIDTDADSRAIVDAILRLGRDLRMSVAAEGVETEGQYTLLRELGCNEIQGYLIGRPQPLEAITQFLPEAAA